MSSSGFNPPTSSVFTSIPQPTQAGTSTSSPPISPPPTSVAPTNNTPTISFPASSSKPTLSYTRSTTAAQTQIPATTFSLPPDFTASPPSRDSPPSAVGATGSSNRLELGEIIAIAVGGSLILLALLAAFISFCTRRRRQRNRRPGLDGDKLGIVRNVSKYGGKEDLPPYDDGLSFTETGGTGSPLEEVHPYSSFHQQDRPLLRDEPVSPFVNGQLSPHETHHIILPNSTPVHTHQKSMSEAQLDTVTLLNHRPSTTFSNNSDFQHTISLLPPLTIPEYRTPPAASQPLRRPSRGKRSMRSGPGSRHGYDSDDSESLYSQMSASTQSTAWLGRRGSQSVYNIALPSRSNSHDSDADNNDNDDTSTIRQSPRPESMSTITPPQYSFLNMGHGQPEQNQDKGLERQKTEVIAKLLKSRSSQAPQGATRSSSVVSHIERNGSIKTVISPEDSREPYGKRFTRMKREREAQRMWENRSSVVPEMPEPYSDARFSPRD